MDDGESWEVVQPAWVLLLLSYIFLHGRAQKDGHHFVSIIFFDDKPKRKIQIEGIESVCKWDITWGTFPFQTFSSLYIAWRGCVCVRSAFFGFDNDKIPREALLQARAIYLLK